MRQGRWRGDSRSSDGTSRAVLWVRSDAETSRRKCSAWRIARVRTAYRMRSVRHAGASRGPGSRTREHGRVVRAERFLTVNTLLNQRYKGIVGENELRKMKPTAYLINTARGPIVKEAALIRALQENWIAGAGLDVFEQEPLPPGSPLRGLDNVILVPMDSRGRKRSCVTTASKPATISSRLREVSCPRVS